MQETLYADVYQELGGQLTAAEGAAVARWRAATGGAAAQQAAAAAEPWVTEQQLQETGMLDNPYHVQVTVLARAFERCLTKIKDSNRNRVLGFEHLAVDDVISRGDTGVPHRACLHMAQ